MRTLSLISAICFFIGQIPGFSEVPTIRPGLAALSHYDSTGAAYSADGKVIVKLREIKTEAFRTTGPRTLSVIVIFDPGTGSFLCDAFDTYNLKVGAQWLSNQFSDGQSAIFLRKKQLIYFSTLQGPPRLFVRGYHGQASNLEDASAKSLKIIGDSADFEGDLDKTDDTHTIALISLGSDFVYIPLVRRANPPETVPKITDLQWDGEHWVVILFARWKAKITLDADYKMISAIKVE